MNARKQVLALGILAAVATSVPALAQSSSKGEPYPTCTRTVTPAESEAAHAKYLSGKVDYDEGKHDAAIQQFKQAYAKDCTKHELLVIISRAYEFKSDFAEAIRALETYLERVPGTPDAATHRSRIETLKGKLADQQRAASAASASPAPVPSASGSASSPSNPPPGAEPSGGHTVYPWIVVGAGVVGVAVGVVLIATTPSIPSNCNENTTTCTRKPGESDAEFKDDQDQAGRGKNQPVIGAVVTGVGGALVLGGLIWHFVEPTGERNAASTKVRPQVGPGYGGLALTGRF